MWEQRGASSVEYAVLAAMIAGAMIAIVFLLGPQVAGLYQRATVGW